MLYDCFVCGFCNIGCYMNYIFSIAWIAQIVILLMYYSSMGLFYSEDRLLELLIMVGINTVFFFIYKKKVRQTIKSGLWSLIFLLGYLIVFFQKYVDLSLGYLGENERFFANQDTILKCAIISLCGLLAFFVGYTIQLNKKNDITDDINDTINNELSVEIPKTTPLKILLSLSLILFVIYNYKMIILGNYSQEMLEAQAGTMGLYSNILFQIVFFLYVSYKSCTFKYLNINSFKSYIKHIGFIVNLCVILYSIFILMSGDRGPVIVICLAYLGGYILSSEQDISYIRLSVLIGLAAFVITLLGNTRKLDSNMTYWDKVNQSVNEMAANDDSFSPYTGELAGSVTTLHHSVEYVPEFHPHLNGSFQLRQLCSSIPFMNHIVYKFVDPHFKYRGSAFFITWIIQGERYTYGSGTSCNADLYLSFGIFGVIIGLLIWGIIYRRIEDDVDSMSISSLSNIVFLFFLAYSLYVNRASLLCFLNFMVFSIILKFLYEKLITRGEEYY